MDTDALAAAFPFASPDLPSPLPGDPPSGGGVLYGINPASNGIVWWDRWAQENHNTVVLARSGAGKSYFVKLEVLRSLYTGVQVFVIDPEDEYLRLAAAVDGTVVRLGAPGVKINPLDLPTGDTRPDVLTRRGLFLHTFVSVLLGEQPAPAERAALDRAILGCYRTFGITPDPATHHRPAPLLRDLASTLGRRPGPGRPNARGPVGAVGHRLVQRPVRRRHHPPTRRAPRRLVPAASPRRAPHRRYPAGPRPHLAPRRPTHPDDRHHRGPAELPSGGPAGGPAVGGGG